MKKLVRLFKEKRIELGMSQEDFSYFLGQSISYVAHIERGRFIPSTKVLKIFSEKTGYSYDKLEEMYWEDKKVLEREKRKNIVLGNRDRVTNIIEKKYKNNVDSGTSLEYNVTPKTVKKIRVPIIKISEAVKMGFYDGRGLPTKKGWETVEAPRMVTDDTFSAIKLEDDSMPFVKPGWTVFCSPNLGVKNDDLVIVKLKRGELLFRQIKFHDDIIILHAFNNSYEDILVKKEDIEFYNKVIEIVTD